MKETSKLNFNDLFSMIDNTSSKSKSEINKKRLGEIDAPENIKDKEVDYFVEKNKILNTFLGNDEERKNKILFFKETIKKIKKNKEIVLNEKEKKLFLDLKEELSSIWKVMQMKKAFLIVWLMALIMSIIFANITELVSLISFILTSLLINKFIEKKINKASLKAEQKLNKLLDYYQISGLTVFEFNNIEQKYEENTVDEKKITEEIKNKKMEKLTLKNLVEI